MNGQWRNFHVMAALLMLPVSVSGPAQANTQLSMTGGATGTYQAANEPGIESEFSASTDLVLDYRQGRGTWHLYLEGNTTQRAGGVSSLLPEANTDAGTALNRKYRGRLQVSEFNYAYEFDNELTVTAGMLDISSYFDQSRIASDENTRFLGVPFVQNPSITFPDYTLGLVFQQTYNRELSWKVGISSSHGLADNTNLSYTQLMNVADESKGLFAITSIGWSDQAWLGRVGAWVNTAAHDSLDGRRRNLANRGLYALAGWSGSHHAVNLRLGMANPEVSRVSGFAGLTYQYQWHRWMFGLGGARIFLSAKEPDPLLDDTSQFETYIRYELTGDWLLTLDLQHLLNSNFARGNASSDSRRVTLYGMRLTFLF